MHREEKRVSLNKEDVTFLVPTLNEADGIVDVIEEIRRSGYKNIIVIDGGSKDGTIEKVKQLGVPLIFQSGKGKADAIKTGLEHVNTEFVAVIDGDATYPANQMDTLLRKILEGYDEVIGFRVYEKGTQSIVYKLGNRILTWFFNILMGTRLTDVLSGMYVVRTDILREVRFEMAGFSVESEIAAHVAATSQKIAEVPIKYRKRKGSKKLGLKHGFFIARDMLRLAWRYNPVFVIFSAGSSLLIVGLVLAGYVLFELLVRGVLHHVKGLLAVLLTVSGFQSLLMSILALYMRRFEYRIIVRLSNLNKERTCEDSKKMHKSRSDQRL